MFCPLEGDPGLYLSLVGGDVEPSILTLEGRGELGTWSGKQYGTLPFGMVSIPFVFPLPKVLDDTVKQQLYCSGLITLCLEYKLGYLKSTVL